MQQDTWIAIECKVPQSYNEVIWKQWTKEYLPQCNVRSNWFRSERREVNVGDFVWIVVELVKKTFYQTGRVLEVHPGSDSIVTSATIKTANGELQRTLAKLALVF